MLEYTRIFPCQTNMRLIGRTRWTSGPNRCLDAWTTLCTTFAGTTLPIIKQSQQVKLKPFIKGEGKLAMALATLVALVLCLVKIFETVTHTRIPVYLVFSNGSSSTWSAHHGYKAMSRAGYGSMGQFLAFARHANSQVKSSWPQQSRLIILSTTNPAIQGHWLHYFWLLVLCYI
jgi:hypothetical protein